MCGRSASCTKGGIEARCCTKGGIEARHIYLPISLPTSMITGPICEREQIRTMNTDRGGFKRFSALSSERFLLSTIRIFLTKAHNLVQYCTVSDSLTNYKVRID